MPWEQLPAAHPLLAGQGAFPSPASGRNPNPSAAPAEGPLAVEWQIMQAGQDAGPVEGQGGVMLRSQAGSLLVCHPKGRVMGRGPGWW